VSGDTFFYYQSGYEPIWASRSVGLVLLARTVPTMSIAKDTFRRHLELLARGYDLVSLDAALDALAGRTSPPRDLAVITFDDGYRGVYHHAYPVMKELGVPGVVYVPSAFVGTRERLLHDRLWDALFRMEQRRLSPTAVGIANAMQEILAAAFAGAPPLGKVLERLISDCSTEALSELAGALEERLGLRGVEVPEGHLNMTWEQLRELRANRIAIGAHTVGHTVLTHLPIAEAARDLRQCKTELEAGLRARVTHFAYCNGWYSPGLAQALRELGFTSAVTTEDLPNVPGVDPFALKRKVLWENSSRGALGEYSEALAACQLDDIFGALSLQAPVLGARPTNLGPARSEAGSRTLLAHG
jgi:peptidoglycan/xylan/chitin deacetylase (PgdA/CDA1 family)